MQEYIESEEGAIVRVEVLDGRFLYAIRIVREVPAGFNLCPADICQVPGAARRSLRARACPAAPTAGLTVARFDAPAEAIEQAVALARAAVDRRRGGGVSRGRRDDGRIYFYDVNATSNFVANAPAVLGFDPFRAFVDYIERVAREGKRSELA